MKEEILDVLLATNKQILGKVDEGFKGIDTKIDLLELRSMKRVEAVDAKIDSLEIRTTIKFDAVDARFDRVEAKIDSLETRSMIKFDAVDARFDRVEDKMDSLEAKVDSLEVKVDSVTENVRKILQFVSIDHADFDPYSRGREKCIKISIKEAANSSVALCVSFSVPSVLKTAASFNTENTEFTQRATELHPQ